MKKFSKIIGFGIGVVAALVISVSTAQAQNILVNPGFESDTLFTANPITLAGVGQGWAFFDGRSSRTDMSSSADSPQEGFYSLLEVNAAGNGWNPAGAYQVVAASASTPYAASIYALTDTGMQGDWWNTPVLFQLGFLASDMTTNGLVGQMSFDAGWSTVTQDAWQQYNLSGTSPAGAAYAVIYAMNMVSGSNVGDVNVYFDNADLHAVPEPGTLALMSLGLAIPLYVIRRRKS
jgi:hypothetical protein